MMTEQGLYVLSPNPAYDVVGEGAVSLHLLYINELLDGLLNIVLTLDLHLLNTQPDNHGNSL